MNQHECVRERLRDLRLSLFVNVAGLLIED